MSWPSCLFRGEVIHLLPTTAQPVPRPATHFDSDLHAQVDRLKQQAADHSEQAAATAMAMHMMVGGGGGAAAAGRAVDEDLLEELEDKVSSESPYFVSHFHGGSCGVYLVFKVLCHRRQLVWVVSILFSTCTVIVGSRCRWRSCPVLRQIFLRQPGGHGVHPELARS